MAQQARELTGGDGVDVVVDPVGGKDRFTDSLRALATAGRAVVVGFTEGSIPEVRVNRLLLNNVDVVGAGWGAYILPRPAGGPRDRRRGHEARGGGQGQAAGGRPLPARAGSGRAAADRSRGALGKVVLDVS